MPFINVCKTESDKQIHLPDSKSDHKTLCGKDAIQYQTRGRQDDPPFTAKQACPECMKIEFPNMKLEKCN